MSKSNVLVSDDGIRKYLRESSRTNGASRAPQAGMKFMACSLFVTSFWHKGEHYRCSLFIDSMCYMFMFSVCSMSVFSQFYVSIFSLCYVRFLVCVMCGV